MLAFKWNLYSLREQVVALECTKETVPLQQLRSHVSLNSNDFNAMFTDLSGSFAHIMN